MINQSKDEFIVGHALLSRYP